MNQPTPGAVQQDAMSAGKIFPGAGAHPEAPTPLTPTQGSPAGSFHASAAARTEAERRLVRRVFTRCDAFIQEACRSSSVPAEFLGALTANESGGNAAAVRFEPSVYRHLKAVAAGERPRYGGIGAGALCEELAEVLHPKTGEFHEKFLNSLFMAGQASELSRLADEALRELASSWGFTQIMGFHVIGRQGTVRDLLQPRFHYHLANQLLAEFAESYQLCLSREFEEMFRCWNTGRPDGRTADPAYVENGLRRMKLYHELNAEQYALGKAHETPQGLMGNK
jgi:hypothetical protein